MIGPLPVVTLNGCDHGPPDEPPVRPQLGRNQLSAFMFCIGSAQYMNCGSTLYEYPSACVTLPAAGAAKLTSIATTAASSWSAAPLRPAVCAPASFTT